MSNKSEAILNDATSSARLAVTRLLTSRYRRLLIGLAIVVPSATLGSAMLFRQKVAWGDVATWALAVISLLAFLAATFAGIVAYDLLKIESARDRAAAEDRRLAAADRQRAEVERAAQREAKRRDQASKVTAWFDYYDKSPQPDGRNMTWGAAIRNASELPIFDVRVFFYFVIDRQDGSAWETDMRYASIERFRVIPPEQTRHLELPKRVRDMVKECNDNLYVVGLEFTDARGTRWMRNARGDLFDPSGQTIAARVEVES